MERIHSSMTTYSMRAQAPEKSAPTGIPAIRLQAGKLAMVYTQAVHRDTVYRVLVATFENFNLSIAVVSSFRSINSYRFSPGILYI